MHADPLASDVLGGTRKYSSLQPCSFSSALNMDTNANMVSARQIDQSLPLPPQTPMEQQNPSGTFQKDHPFLPPLDIDFSSKEERNIGLWSAVDSCWTLTPTTMDKSVEPILDKDDIGTEKSNTTTRTIQHVSPSLKPSSSDEKSISILSLPISAVPLSVEDPSSMPSMSTLRKIALVLVACSAQFLNLGGMNQTVAPVMVLADYFQIRDYGTLSWFSAAYSMTVGTFILPAGKSGLDTRVLAPPSTTTRYSNQKD